MTGPSRMRRGLLCAVLLIVAGGVGAAFADPSDPVPATEQSKSFDVHEYRVLGNTVLSNRDIERTLYPLLGDHKTIADVETARAALEKTYHDRGFGTVFVDIPEQEIAEKIVRLKVTEGHLNEVRILGARYYSERQILAEVPQAQVGAVPNLPELQKELSAVGVKTADRSVVPILKAGPTPGTIDLSLKVDDHLPLHGSLELDNQNTPSTEPLRLTAALSYGNLFQNMDNLAVQYQVAPQNEHEVSVAAINYSWGATFLGLHPSVYFVDSNSNVPTVSTLGVLGKGQIAGARFAFFTDNSLDSPQSITLGADYKHFDQSIALAAAGSINTPITYSNFSVAYGGSWRSNKLSGSLSSAANFGVRGVPNETETFANKRYEGQPNYFYVKLDGSLTAVLPGGLQLILRADGQYAVEPLITNEDFAITGIDGVRGYLEAEVLADKGLKGSVQLQSPTFKERNLALGNVFVFYDTGRAEVIDALPGEPGHYELSSYGVGVTVLPSYWLNGLLTWAEPLRNGPYTRRDASRILFSVRAGF